MKFESTGEDGTACRKEKRLANNDEPMSKMMLQASYRHSFAPPINIMTKVGMKADAKTTIASCIFFLLREPKFA